MPTFPVMGRSGARRLLRAKLKDTEERREQVKAMVAQNKSLAEVEKMLPEPDAIPGFEVAETVYKELTAGYPPAHSARSNFVNKP